VHKNSVRKNEDLEILLSINNKLKNYKIRYKRKPRNIIDIITNKCSQCARHAYWEIYIGYSYVVDT